MVGKKASYKKEDVIRATHYISKEPISRQQLSKKLEVGEGSIRSILDILKKKKLIISNNKGHELSKKGEKKRLALKEKFESKRITSLKIYKRMKNSCLLIKKPRKTKISFELRDEAIREGAYSAMIFRYENGLKLPNSETDFKKEYKKDYETIKSLFEYKKNQILIITSAKNYYICENACLKVAKKIMKINI